MESINNFYNKTNQSVWSEWIFRIAFSLEFIQTAAVIQEEHYPDACWLLLFISIWIYFFRQKLIALIPLLFAAFIHYTHYRI
jgi:hypothetical protein